MENKFIYYINDGDHQKNKEDLHRFEFDIKNKLKEITEILKNE